MKKVSKIGGQAVLEGVMMRGSSSMATAVRLESGEIAIESSRFIPNSERGIAFRMPILRGIIAFFRSFALGMKTISRSSAVFGETEEEAGKFEKWLAKTFKVDIMNVVIAIGVILGVAFALGLFVVIPQIITNAIFKNVDTTGFANTVYFNLTAGGFRLVIFILYIVLVSLMKDIKRLFMYHGAEHKVISCFEHDMELTVENAKTFTTVHDRCGTTFTFIVMFISILFFAAFPVDILVNGSNAVNFLLRVVTRILLIPIVAGISFEILQFLAKFDNFFVSCLKFPGLLLQKLTTKEPTDDMIEVAIAAFNEVQLLESDKEFPIKTFDIGIPVEQAVSKIEKKVNSLREAELIMCQITGAKTITELYGQPKIKTEAFKDAEKIADMRASGAPLQYCMGFACFYGLDFKVREGVLIPRQDTEILVEAVINKAKTYDNPAVLDLCTGSGAIAIAVKLNALSEVTASDLTDEAIRLTNENATLLKADIKVKQGNLFDAVIGERFDIIASNPPYIPSNEIATLDKSVREYEPNIALDGGNDGLDFYRKIIESAPLYLNEGGYLCLEAGIGQAEQIKNLMSDFCEIEIMNDYNNPPVARVIIGKIAKIK